ncbi:ABC transporter permease [Hippea maritima]|uniref:ABC-type transporter, integral membrane subunit n=1 Tax=Hippea maritima (strain ATCC 700847 / DSM 10411 / MH2) TaxID=760142 RepID=F2LWY4_HIPMA|nr:ABC transporter permease [Hippea maritima]AEA34168.1 ABC-type transporter, integral membrane subunit [Hippea maritima DSM 10411]
MLSFTLRKKAELIPTFFGITFIIFIIIHLSPGNPVNATGGFNPNVSYESLKNMEKIYHLNEPVYVQYWEWLKSLVRLDFGYSLIDGVSVSKKILSSLPITLLINIVVLVLSISISIPIGIIGAAKKDSWIDKFFTFFVFSGYAMPSFWLALLLMILLSVKWHILPLAGLHSFNAKPGSFGWYIDEVKHLAMPIFIGVFGSLAGFSRYVRSGVIDTLDKDFVKLMFIRGISKKRILYKHALKNALLPLITIMGLSIPSLIGGSVIIESIFAIPGMGRLFYFSAMARDYPTVMGILTISTILTLFGNLIADICYALTDPRIKYD